jgi:hypothetical protein
MKKRWIFLLLLLVLSSCVSLEAEDVEEEVISIVEDNLEVEPVIVVNETMPPLEKTATCNFNNLCEGWESSCSDCECQGTVCGGVCYGHEGTCCNGLVIPGEDIICAEEDIPDNSACQVPGGCSSPGSSISVVLDIPALFPIGETVLGQVTVINGVEAAYTLELKVPENMRVLKDTVTGVTVGPRERAVYDVEFIADEDFDTLNKVYSNPITVRVGDGGYSFFNPVFYERKNSVSCGDKIFDIEGTCRGEVFYPGSRCLKDDEGFDYCSNGIVINKSHLNIYNPYTKLQQGVGGVVPKGEVNVVMFSVNGPIDVDVTEFGNEVEAFYDREAVRITGKKMIDFNFVDGGAIGLDENGRYNSTFLAQEFDRKTYGAFSDYDIKIGMFKPGLKVFNDNRLAEHQSPGKIMYKEGNTNILTHELGHVFNAIDLYFNYTNQKGCDTYLSNCLMCGGMAKVAASEQVLCTASLLGWGDLNNNGILDVDDNFYKRFELNYLVATVQSDKVLLSVQMQDRGQVVSGDLVVQSLYGTEKGSISEQDFLYTLKHFPSKKTTYAVTVSYGGNSDTKSITIDPEIVGYYYPE